MFGKYVESAVFSSVQNSLHGRKSNAKYAEQPILQQTQDKNIESGEMSEEEKKKKVELLFMQLQVQASNFKREKKIKEQGGAV